MADIHVLSGDGSQWQIVMHFAVPSADNAVGVNYRTALVNSGLGGTTSMTVGSEAGQITLSEKSQIEAGELLEVSANLAVDGVGVDNASRLAAVRSFYVSTKAAEIAKLQIALKFFGWTASEA